MTRNSILQNASGTAPQLASLQRREKGEPAILSSTPPVALPLLIDGREVRFSARAFRCRETGTEAICLLSPEGRELLADEPIVRVHSGCVTGDVFHSLRCDCHEQLLRALTLISNANGVLIYLPSHEGRGIGLFQKMRAYSLQESGFDTVDANTAIGAAVDARDFSFAAAILKALGVNSVRLLTNNPAKVAALQSCGIGIAARLAIEVESNRHNERYLATKRDRLAHAIHANGPAVCTPSNTEVAQRNEENVSSGMITRFPAKSTSRRLAFSPTDDILADFRNGRMIVLVDAEDRENEGDLIIPAQMATPAAINFMAKHGRGLICLALTQARANELHLQFMVRRNESRNRTAFTQSIEAREGVTTGISASDRARTIATAIDPTKGASDIVSPGHVFPLIAREGGVLVRAGHTEAAVDLARLAGLLPAAVICEIMNEDGSMARVPDLLSFAQQHGLKIGTIDDLIAYRLRNECLVRQVAETKVHSAFGGVFDLKVFSTSVEPTEHLALVKGNIASPGPVLVRVHDVNAMSDLLGVGLEAGADPLIAKALEAIGREGRGVLVLIRNPDPYSVSNWINRHARQSASKDGTYDFRQVETGIGSQILRHLKVREMTLLTNSSVSDYVGIEAFGLTIVGVRRFDTASGTSESQDRCNHLM